MITAALTGFFTAFSLILAIGAQNAFVLRQGILRSHVLPIVFFCALSDAILIVLGVVGFGSIVNLYPSFPTLMALAGAAFLLCYGFTRFLAAWRADYEMTVQGKAMALKPALLTVAAFTWLNPHVYLDTLGLIGAVSTQYPGTSEKLAFAIAAVSASFVFFFSLGYGAALLAPIMQTSRAWQILDTLIGIVMLILAFGLITSLH